MRCVDLARTWTDLRTWLDRSGVLVLPPLTADGPLVRLDDAAAIDPISPTDPAAAVRRLKILIERLQVPAVYVGQRSWARASVPDPGELTTVTVRVLAAGVIHELLLVAAWYDDLTEPTLGAANGERVKVR